MKLFNFAFDNASGVPFEGREGASRHSIANPSVTDVELINAFFKGDEESFVMLLNRHLSGVYALAYRYLGNADDASDVAQETFIRAWKHLNKFDTSRNFKTWILAIAKNASLDHIKKKKPVLFSKIEEGDGELDTFLAPYVESPELPSELLERKDTGEMLERALIKLPPAYQAVLSLRYHEDLKFREIAEVLGEPIDTVKSKHRRGLLLLKKAL